MAQAVLFGAMILLGGGDAVSTETVSLMTKSLLGDFEPDGWEGYACTFADWTACVKSGPDICALSSSPCQRCRSTRSPAREPIRCAFEDNRTKFFFPAGGVFPVVQQFTIPANTELHGAADPNDPDDQTAQQTRVGAHTWFVVPAADTLCGSDPFCNDTTKGAKGLTACTGDPHTHRQGFLMSSNTSLRNINFQGADLGRSSHEGHLCGPGAVELPGCLSGDGCPGNATWGSEYTNGRGPVRDVLIQNVRLSDAVKRAEVAQMGGNCRTGEALDADGAHVRAHQVSVWVPKLPGGEPRPNANVRVDNLVSMNSRADGLNVHGSVDGFVLERSHIENSGDDCIGVWGTGISGMLVRNVTAANCAVTTGANGLNWGSCLGTYAFRSLAVDGLRCFEPFASADMGVGGPDQCPPRTHWTAVHLNHAYSNDCMPEGSALSLSRVEYHLSAGGREPPFSPVGRPKCGSCRSCCQKACSFRGFDDLKIDYRDGSVPEGSCMNYTVPGC